MGQKAITIFTPSGASAHISAEDDAFVHRCMLGADNGIIGSLSCVKVDDNTVRLSGGGVSNHGYIMWIPEGETLELSVDAGVAGYNRIDTVASVFTRGGGDVADTHTLTVIKGTAVTGTPSAPSLSSSQLLTQGNVNQTAVFYINISGTAITSITRAASVLPAASSAPAVFVQQSAPSNPSTGDLWLW
jgi:hypothetical protein